MHKLNLCDNKNLPVIFIQDPTSPLSLVSFWVKSGSVDDPQNKTGLAHFAEHVYGKRIENLLPSYEKYGIVTDAFTASDYTFFYHLQRKEETNASIDLLSQYISPLTRSFINEHFEKEKEVIINEIQQRKEDDCYTLYRQSLWQGTPYVHDVKGSLGHVTNISHADIENFVSNHYTAENIFLVCFNCGDIKSTYEKLCSITSSFPKKQKNLGEKIAVQNVKNAQNCDEIWGVCKTSPLSFEERMILNLVRAYLSIGWNSVLQNRLRTNVSTYWLDMFVEHYKGGSALLFSTHTSENDINTLKEVVNEALEELQSGKVNVEVFNLTRALYVTHLLQGYQDPFVAIKDYGEDWIINEKVISIDNYIQKIFTSTSKDLINFSQKYLHEFTWL